MRNYSLISEIQWKLANSKITEQNVLLFGLDVTSLVKLLLLALPRYVSNQNNNVEYMRAKRLFGTTYSANCIYTKTIDKIMSNLPIDY